MLQHSGAALAKTVDVNSQAKIVELAMGRDFSRLPDRAFGHFSISQQDINAVVLPLKVAKVDGQP